MTVDPMSSQDTHEVMNQPPSVGDRNLWQDDPLLQGIVSTSDLDTRLLETYGGAIGRFNMREAASDANRHLPELRLFDSGGRRLDEVRYHPAYHQFMKVSTAAGYQSVAWEGGPHGHLAHACMVYLASQVEPGHCCPLTMTYAAVPVLSRSGMPAQEWSAKLLSREYDPSVRPVRDKRGATLGMAMTEKQGGSDVRSNTTRAEQDGEIWRLTGHKWFCSAPMSDGFLTLAQAPEGLTCFLVPRWLEGERNRIEIQRLKDKLGNRSNASAEIEYRGALAHQVGAGGDGVRTIVEMVHHTRLDTAIAPAGLMRAALREAHHWASHRSAFQKRLIDQPLMTAVLSDIAIDWAGSLALGLHVASRFDQTSDEDRAYARVAVALAKYAANKLCPLVVFEAMEAMGGMGYVDDTLLPMLFRESPLNGIWEGSANVICLDVLRTLERAPLASEMLSHELTEAKGHDPRYDVALDTYRERWSGEVAEAEARWFVETTAELLTASVLLRSPPTAFADAYLSTRLRTERGRTRGAIQSGSAKQVLAGSFAEALAIA